jgi:predicted negative regulator of RcsB-dependent stress response
MESDATQFAIFYKLWAWSEAHKKQLLWGAIAVIVAGLGITFWVLQQDAKQNNANDALSKVSAHGLSANSVDALLKVVSDYSGTPAAERAALLAASELFMAGKYTDAQAQFQKYLKDYAESPFIPQAALGVAACLDAQGKTNEAITAYQNVADRYGNENVVPQAKFAKARLLEAQGKLQEARNLYADLNNTVRYGSIAEESAFRMEELTAAHPELAPTNPPPAAMPPINVEKK